MKDQNEKVPVRIHLKDYQPHPYIIQKTELSFELSNKATRVESLLHFSRRETASAGAVCDLNGEHLKLLSVELNGEAVAEENYDVDDEKLSIRELPEQGTLKIVTEINPEDNKALEGLYKSGDIFCTQMEPEGFRRVTYFIDRPDNLSVFTTTIIADKTLYPQILSNGNLKEEKDLGDGRHMAVWEDPFPKPNYLFALVAGNLGIIEDTYKTVSGRDIELKVYVDKGNEGRAYHAMESLKKAMKWDEDVYGLEYDLDLYMIVAVDAFNFGAMENKGLNIFNSTAVLADEKTATDFDFYRIEGIVAHEYFHNWTGNRVTCRDWFQLTLKEGLTVFRDQCFSADMHSAGVCRIQDVNSVRNRQFAEDSGPTAHPIRPASYIEINNFYTATVYEKGAEVIRMIHTMIGAEAYRKGIDLYFERHDGSAVTTEDFLSAMSDASGYDLSQFEKSWYNQKGTPQLEAKWNYDESAKVFELTLSQNSADTDNKEWMPWHIPVKMGLVSPEGKDIDIDAPEGVIHLKEKEQSFKFENIESAPVPSLLRNFSAPVKLSAPYSQAELIHLMLHDSDPFSRFEAGQKILLDEIERLMPLIQGEQTPEVNADIIEALGKVLADESLEESYRSEFITLPALNYILENVENYQPTRAFLARECLDKAFASSQKAVLSTVYSTLKAGGCEGQDTASAGRRSLKNKCLQLLALDGQQEEVTELSELYKNASNMTDTMHAMSVLCNYECNERDEALNDFVAKWKNDPVVMNKWFAAQASSKLADTIDKVKTLIGHDCFDAKNPNKIRSLFGAFCGNLLHFHRKDGEGYKFVADQVIEIDGFNPNVASSLAGAFKKYSRLDEVRQKILKTELDRILAKEGLSKDVYEIVSKIVESV